MELRQFISDVLESIIVGVKEAESVAVDHGAIINPYKIQTEFGGNNLGRKTSTKIHGSQLVEFDIALTVEDSSGKDGGAQISVLSVGLGGKLSSSSHNSTVSRVKFAIPVVLQSVGGLKGDGESSL